MRTVRSVSAAARYLVLLATMAGVLLLGIGKPLHNWDMIGYAGSAYQLDGYRGQALLDRTYRDVRSEVDADTFQTLTRGEHESDRHYRETVASDPKALSEQLPFYSIRVVFVEAIRFVGRLGTTYSKATYVVSAIASALAVFALSRILLASGVHFAVLPVLTLVSGLPEVARESVADAPAILVALLCVWALLRGSAMSFVCAAILPLMRTDYIIISCLILAVEFVSGKRVAATIAMALSIVAYLAVNRASGNYGWLTLVNFSALSHTPYPAALTPSLNWKDYAKAYLFAIYDVTMGPEFGLLFIATYLLYSGLRRLGVSPAVMPRFIFDECRRNRPLAGLYVVPVLYALSHVALFPHYEGHGYDERYFVFCVALVFVWILARERTGRVGLPAFSQTASESSSKTRTASAIRSGV